ILCRSRALPFLITLSLHDALPISGDRFIAEGWVSALSPPPNPHAFDLRQYYHTLGIRHRLNTNGSQVIPLSQVGISLMRFPAMRSEEHTSELQSRENLVCRLLLEK